MAAIGAGSGPGSSMSAVIRDRLNVQNLISIYRKVSLVDDAFLGHPFQHANDLLRTFGTDRDSTTLASRKASDPANAISAAA